MSRFSKSMAATVPSVKKRTAIRINRAVQLLDVIASENRILRKSRHRKTCHRQCRVISVWSQTRRDHGEKIRCYKFVDPSLLLDCPVDAASQPGAGRTSAG